MGKNISIFNPYVTKENQVTNYCGLMFRLVYEESPSLFNELLALCIAGQAIVPTIGPVIEQQNRKKQSVPDLEIRQDCFQIFFETKNEDWFDIDQLKRHIADFKECCPIKILFLLSSEFDKININGLVQVNPNVSIIKLTFEELTGYLETVCQSPMLKRYLNEFEDFLDLKNLLDTWKKRLDVVNCIGSKNEILTDLVYMCPAAGGAYSHKRAKYFGAYWDKKVNFIFNIDAVVDVELGGANCKICYKNDTSLIDKDLEFRAMDVVKKYRSHEILMNAIRVFLLSDMNRVNFRKDTNGGMYSSKIYFSIECNNLSELKAMIDGNVWSRFKP